MNFTQLEVQPEIVKAIEKIGIYEPTVIQEKVIPLILQGKDVIGMSRTGSGKTLAFGVPAVQNIRHGAGLQVLILTPTRELAVQITGELKKYAVNLNCFVTTVYGGVSYDAQVKSIKQADIVVATPGRLLDHLRQRTINLSKVKTFILDEADKLSPLQLLDLFSK